MLKKLTKMLLGCLVSLYIAVCLFMYLNQVNMVFHPRPVDIRLKQQHAESAIELKQGQVSLHGWLSYKEQDGPFVFYYGGNAEEVSNKISWFADIGIHNYFLLNYRGYGDST